MARLPPAHSAGRLRRLALFFVSVLIDHLQIAVRSHSGDRAGEPELVGVGAPLHDDTVSCLQWRLHLAPFAWGRWCCLLRRRLGVEPREVGSRHIQIVAMVQDAIRYDLDVLVLELREDLLVAIHHHGQVHLAVEQVTASGLALVRGRASLGHLLFRSLFNWESTVRYRPRRRDIPCLRRSWGLQIVIGIRRVIFLIRCTSTPL